MTIKFRSGHYKFYKFLKMKYYIIFFVLINLGCVFTKNAEISYGVIFFENSYFQGRLLFALQKKNKTLILKYIFNSR